ncbi:hypothetical protein [Rhodohalobacter halophilus]|uniref:hypothetical protein n=1 Tax=Rhodohalobacter halophilus TaxID=1812810 RepID=UPI00083FB2D9|nr:hypothetical protein [Rhodohalobacter halophilus]
MNLTKKSLGHFPFQEHKVDESEFSFIPDINGGERRESLREVGSEPEGFSLNRELRKFREEPKTDEEISKHLVERDVPEPVEEEAPKKKVASYYLEVDLIDRLKTFSDKINRSYSAVVTDAIERFISKKGY